MSNVARMHDIECAVAHNNFSIARPRADKTRDLVGGLDFMADDLTTGRINHDFTDDRKWIFVFMGHTKGPLGLFCERAFSH